MKIAGVQRSSLIDYPGRIAATVFLAGCNLDCGYCYNRWMLDESGVTPALAVSEFVRWLRTRVGRLDAVCITGGEPTIHPDLRELLLGAKALGMAVKLDTNGTHPERLEQLIHEGLVNYVALDLKAPLDERYAVIAGRPVDLRAIRRSIAVLRGSGLEYELRTTVGPQVDAAALHAMAPLLRPEERWFLQPFVPTTAVLPTIAQAPALREEALSAIVEQLTPLAPGIRLRGS